MIPRADLRRAGDHATDATRLTGTFAMEGSRGQYAVIVPSAHIIVVRRGFDPLHARFDIDRFTHDALGVLKGQGDSR